MTNEPEKQPEQDISGALMALRHRLTWLEPLLQNKGFQSFMEECLGARGAMLQKEALNIEVGDKDSRDLAARKAALIAELYRWPGIAMRNCRAEIEKLEAQRTREKSESSAPTTTPGF